MSKTYSSSFDKSFWIDASNEINLKEEYLKIPPKAQVERDISAVKAWLSEDSRTWMLVLDDVDPLLLEINKFFPSTPKGCLIVMTSTNRNLAQYAGAGVQELEQMTMAEALELFKGITSSQSEPFRSSDEAEVNRLIQDLGGFALAVDVAGSYIISSGQTISEYRELLQDEWESGFTLNDEVAWTGYNKSILNAWSISYNAITKAKDSSDYAVSLLNFWSFLHSQRIPIKIIAEAWRNVRIKDNEFARGKALEVLEKEPVSRVNACVQKTIHDLQKYSFIGIGSQSNQHNHDISMPSLLHRWLREKMSNKEKWICWCKAMLTMAIALNDEHATPDYRRELSPHIDHLLSLNRDKLFEMPYGPKVCYDIASKFADNFSEIGFPRKAKELQQIIRAAAKESISSDPLPYVDASRQMARSLNDLGEHYEAMGVQKELLALLKPYWPRYSLPLLRCWIDLSASLQETQRSSEALEECRKIVKQYQELQEIEVYRVELDTVSRMLATSIRESGQIKEAMKVLHGCIERQVKYANECDHELLLSMNELAICYEHYGEPRTAMTLYFDVLERRKKGHHQTHDILAAKAGVAAIYTEQKLYKEALQTREEIVDGWKTLQDEHGHEHPNYLIARSHRAKSLSDNGRHDEGLEEFHKILQIRRRRMGENHPATLETKKYIALLLRRCERSGEALELLQEVVREWEQRDMEESFREVSFAKNQLANAYREVEDFPKALSLRETLLAQQRLLDPDQRQEGTLFAMREVVEDHMMNGDNEIAIAKGEEALEAQRKHLGPDHWLIIDTCVLLANQYRTRAHEDGGEVASREALLKAIELLEYALERQRNNYWKEDADRSSKKIQTMRGQLDS